MKHTHELLIRLDMTAAGLIIVYRHVRVRFICNKPIARRCLDKWRFRKIRHRLREHVTPFGR